jgi:hypothetical protein
MSSGSCSGLKVGRCCFTGAWKALLIPARGLAVNGINHNLIQALAKALYRL